MLIFKALKNITNRKFWQILFECLSKFHLSQKKFWGYRHVTCNSLFFAREWGSLVSVGIIASHYYIGISTFVWFQKISTCIPPPQTPTPLEIPIEPHTFLSIFWSYRSSALRKCQCLLQAREHGYFLELHIIMIVMRWHATVPLRTKQTKICINNVLTTQRAKCIHAFCCVRRHLALVF